jgi:hypothetical protein
MAWHYARYVDSVAAAGKAEYPLPTFVNAALNRPGRAPGQYPSAGPLPHLLDVWRAGAPSIDLLCPDIYFFNFPDWAARYANHPGNTLFVPESSRVARAPANAFMTFGRFRGVGYSPFHIEYATGTDGDMIAGTYATLRELTPLLTGVERTVAIEALSPTVRFDGSMDPAPQVVTVGPYRLTVTFDGVTAASNATTHPTAGGDPSIRGPGLPRSSGLICFTADDAYMVVGTGVKITHASTVDREAVGFVSVDEFRPNADRWSPFCRLNGDQTNQGREVHLGSDAIEMLKVRLYRFR